jgi:holliday junction DNA helicase RuvA
MYSYIDGRLVAKDPTTAVIDVGGIGYQLRISLNTFSQLGSNERCKLYTHFYVKEDQQVLFGFFEEAEKNLFLKLIGITGVGPSTGLMVLSSMTVEECVEAIVQGHNQAIERVKGIGKKTAQRIVLELKDKVTLADANGSGTVALADGHQGSGVARKLDAIQGLVALGLQKAMAEKMISDTVKLHGAEISVEDMIKLSLKNK